jgi:hypothetical protein
LHSHLTARYRRFVETAERVNPPVRLFALSRPSSGFQHLAERAYFEIAVSKTAGLAEAEAWNWLLEKAPAHYTDAGKGLG